MKHRKEFTQLYGIAGQSPSIDAKTKALLKDFARYFEAYPSHLSVDAATFIPRFNAWHPNLNEEQKGSYHKTIAAAVTKEVDEDQKKNIVSWMADVETATTMANIVEKYNAGDLPDMLTAIADVQNQYRARLGIKFTSFITDSIEDLLAEEFDASGLQWRLQCLRDSMRGLRGGDFGIIAGRPDKGKTSFLASELTYMAGQLPEDRNVIWLNNEGPGKRIKPRLYQAALDDSLVGLKQRLVSGTLIDDYNKVVGRNDKIRIFDIHGMTNGQVELILEDNNPGLVVFDMIDNIKGFGDAARTDLMLESMYQWARERMVKFDCAGMATSQISNDGDGLQYPTLGMLKDSKTGKQGACDFQLMIGSSNDPVFAGSRFLGLPKNKLRRPDGPADPRAEVIFDGNRSRYRDVGIGPPGADRQPVVPVEQPGQSGGTDDLSELTAPA